MNNQFKPIEVYIHDSVNDKDGRIHRITACGLGFKGVGVGVGISITNPVDVHNQQLGQVIAKGRAFKSPCVSISIMPKYPLTKVAINKMVENVVADLKAHPDAFIGGFTKKFKKTKPVEVPLNGTIQVEPTLHERVVKEA